MLLNTLRERLIWRLRDDEFKEHQHPRGKAGTGKGGQFVKKGEGEGAEPSETETETQKTYPVSAKASTLLKALGYKKQKGEPLFVNESTGAEILFYPPAPGKQISFTWTSKGPGWRIEKNGHGVPALENLLKHGGGPKITVHSPAGKTPAKPAVPESAFFALKDFLFGHVSTNKETGAVLFSNGSDDVTVTPKPDGIYWEYKPSGEEPILGKGLPELYENLAEAEHETNVPATNIKAPIKASDLIKIGLQMGSNPGGVYQDLLTGNKFYVKQPPTSEHAANELLAAALFGAAGGNTLVYHPVENGSLAVGTELEKLDKNNISQLSPAEKKAAQRDFALHAWLANWDAAGLSGDNVGVVGTTVLPLDFGGALLYRAKGQPKGSAFNAQATEWTTLRDPLKNPSAAKLYGDMTPQQLKESAVRLDNINDEQIKTLVDEYLLGSSDHKAAVTNTLIARKQAIVQQAFSAKAPSAEPPPPPPKPAPVSAGDIQASIDSGLFGQAYDQLETHKPVASATEAAARSSYVGDGYKVMNDCMRHQHDCTDHRVKTLQSWLDKASTPIDLTVWRRVKGDFESAMFSIATVGMRWQERGFVSTSLDPNVMKTWGRMTMKITVPKGMPGTAVNNKNESEVLFNRGVYLKITHFDRTKRYMECEMDTGE